MGVHHLTTLIQKHVPDGFKDVDIKQECRNYERKHNQRPLLVIDLHGVLRLTRDSDPITRSKNEDIAKREILCGGRYPKYKINSETLIRNLSEVAELVFFVDGSVVSDKIDHWMENNHNKYLDAMKIFDKIKEGVNLSEITQKSREIPPTTSSLKITEVIAKQYGKLIKTITQEADAEIAKYANENRALAVLAEDSDFLIYKGNWRYFSTKSLDIFSLTTKEYNKKALWDFFGFRNFYQMAMLATLAGNDLVHFDEVKRFHGRWLYKLNWEYNIENKFLAIADFVLNKLNGSNSNYIIEVMAREINRYEQDRLKPMIKSSIAMYHTTFQTSSFPPELDGISCCRNFINNIISAKIIKFSVLYYDLRQNNPKILDAELKIFRKQLGAVIRDPSKDFEIIVKQGHDDPYERIKVKPEHPEDFELPPLAELVDAEKNSHHNEVRWKFLKWILDNGKNREIERIPQEIFLDILILNFLTNEGFLNIFEADLILKTIRMVQSGNYERELEDIPEKLNPRAFIVSNLFPKFYQPVTRCVKLAGLGRLKKLIDYDGVIFHNLYLRHSHLSEDPNGITHLLEDDLLPHRIYAA